MASRFRGRNRRAGRHPRGSKPLNLYLRTRQPMLRLTPATNLRKNNKNRCSSVRSNRLKSRGRSLATSRRRRSGPWKKIGQCGGTTAERIRSSRAVLIARPSAWKTWKRSLHSSQAGHHRTDTSSRGRKRRQDSSATGSMPARGASKTHRWRH